MDQQNLPAPVVEPQELTQEYVINAGIELYSALEDATDDGGTAVMIIEELTKVIKSDPAIAKETLTPENIAKFFNLKKKMDAGSIQINDVTDAFPATAKFLPIVSMLGKMKFF
ncbi:hypothetical protein [Spirosoma pomorum]